MPLFSPKDQPRHHPEKRKSISIQLSGKFIRRTTRKQYNLPHLRTKGLYMLDTCEVNSYNLPCYPQKKAADLGN